MILITILFFDCFPRQSIEFVSVNLDTNFIFDPLYYKQNIQRRGMGVGTGGHRGQVPPPPPNNFAKLNFPYSVCTLIQEIGA